MKNTFELYHINGKKLYFKNIFNGTKFKEPNKLINLNHGPIHNSINNENLISD